MTIIGEDAIRLPYLAPPRIIKSSYVGFHSYARYIEYESKLDELRKYRKKQTGIKGKDMGEACMDCLSSSSYTLGTEELSLDFEYGSCRLLFLQEISPLLTLL